MRRSLRASGRALVLAPSFLLAAMGVADAQQPPAAPDKIALGDWMLSPSLELRVRGEYRRDPSDLGGRDFFGRTTPRVRDSWMVMERSRLGLGVERGAVRAQLTLQDARALGAPSASGRVDDRGVGTFGPYEAFLEAHGTGARPHYLRLGRQAVVWGEGRLLGNADFSPSGRSLDAARGHLAFGDFDVEALAAMLEVPSPLGNAFRDTAGPHVSGVQLFGVNVRLALDPLLRIEAYGLARISRSRGADLDGSRFAVSRLSGERYTAALRISGDARGWSYGAEGAYQLGSTSTVALGGADIAAWAAAGHVQKTVEQLPLTPTFRLMGSYASGDNARGAYKQFDPILPDPQRFHGQMDLFSWSNMIDIGGRVQVVPWVEGTVSVEYRYARLADARGEWIGSYMSAIGSAFVPPVIATTPPAAPVSNGSELGHELGITTSWRPWAPLELRAGWTGLLLGDGAKGILRAHARGKTEASGAFAPADVAHYAYLQATVSMP